ncbi:MAG: DUF1566 domain-containing protein [Candidatus Manganitrophus sp.]|nr:MAG: DUF1566 domain-containing protein [Candidatus Manganitrophus sp.]
MRSLFLAVVMTLSLFSTTHATLISLGDKLIYDSEFNITWYDFTKANNSDGWASPEGWVNALNYSGFDDWRLPTIDELVALDNYFMETGSIGPFTDICRLGSTCSRIEVIQGVSFTKFPSSTYLTSTDVGPHARLEYHLDTHETRLETRIQRELYSNASGIAVRAGMTVPTPSTILLLSVGMLGMILMRSKLSFNGR